MSQESSFDHLEFEFAVSCVRVVAPHVRIDAARPGERPDGAHLKRVLLRQLPDSLDAPHKAGLRRPDLSVVVEPLLEDAEHFDDLLSLLVTDIAPDAADGVDRVIDAVPADLLESRERDLTNGTRSLRRC
jgi:hypothetical protein